LYVVPIHVPIYVDGSRCLVAADWYRALELLRDSFAGRYGPVTVVSPSLRVESLSNSQTLVEVADPSGDIVLLPDFDLKCRARQYWLQHRKAWQAKLAGVVARARVVHGGFDDVYRPIAFEGVRLALRLNKPLVFVQDTDIVVQHRQLAADQGTAAWAEAAGYSWIYERVTRWSVARADLSLLKGSALMRRYAAYARNAREFHDTSYFASDIVSEQDLERRLAGLSDPRPLRLVYCGRLARRKGIDTSLSILARAAALGARVRLDIIGEGEERAPLEALAGSLGVNALVRFLGAFPYDPDLLRRLSGYDALFFTPAAEDTPRMIFDGYAAGLPLVASAIGYVLERHAQERATIVLPRDGIDESAMILLEMDRNRGNLAELSRRARDAAAVHSSEYWYRQRAQWTIEAVERHDFHAGS
jgi:glycosyltransferase involved in cell wall biosynthesis